jgi:hypothetical protein
MPSGNPGVNWRKDSTDWATFSPSRAGLPDGLFSHQKSKFGKILEGLAMEDVGICTLRTLGQFYGLLLYFIDIWYSLW